VGEVEGTGAVVEGCVRPGILVDGRLEVDGDAGIVLTSGMVVMA
jgi:hypothetical protein